MKSTSNIRNLIFLSHANPEDNEFTRWLALQLARQGYQVWCDINKFLGGEDFWEEAEKAIREGTAKFLYILSTSSNRKKGPRKELQMAEHVARDLGFSNFIVPLLIDTLPYKDINISLTTLDAISFYPNRADGLRRLMKRLHIDNITQSALLNDNYIARWWQKQFDSENKLIQKHEVLYSNWFPVTNLPEVLYYHRLSSPIVDIESKLQRYDFPAFYHSDSIVTHAPLEDLLPEFRRLIYESSSVDLRVDPSNSGGQRAILRKIRPLLIRLFRIGWEKAAQRRGLPSFDLSNDAKCFYFPKDLVKNDKVNFSAISGESAYRYMVGYKTINDRKKRHWHFGIYAKPLLYPTTCYAVRPHVLFSSDGQAIWSNSGSMHRARRSQCKDWWNELWRDRILATIQYLANGEPDIDISWGTRSFSQVAVIPLLFESPVIYTGDYSVQIEEYDIVEEEEENLIQESDNSEGSD